MKRFMLTLLAVCISVVSFGTVPSKIFEMNDFLTVDKYSCNIQELAEIISKIRLYGLMSPRTSSKLFEDDIMYYPGYRCTIDLTNSSVYIEETDLTIKICHSVYSEDWVCIYNKLSNQISECYIRYERSQKNIEVDDFIKKITNTTKDIDIERQKREKIMQMFWSFLFQYLHTDVINNLDRFYDYSNSVSESKKEKQKKYDDFRNHRLQYYISEFESSLNILESSPIIHLDFIQNDIKQLGFNSIDEIQSLLVNDSYFKKLQDIYRTRYNLFITIKSSEYIIDKDIKTNYYNISSLIKQRNNLFLLVFKKKIQLKNKVKIA